MYVNADDTAPGVPDISPVEVEKVSPNGRSGVMAQEVTVPPLAVGVAGVMAEPFVKVNGLAGYETAYGERSLTWMVTVA